MKNHEEAGMTAWCNQAQATYDLALPESDALTRLQKIRLDSRAEDVSPRMVAVPSLHHLHELASSVTRCIPNVTSSLGGSSKGTSERGSYSSQRRWSLDSKPESEASASFVVEEDAVSIEGATSPKRQVSEHHMGPVTYALSSVGSWFSREKYQAKIASIIDSCRGLRQHPMEDALIA